MLAWGEKLEFSGPFSRPFACILCSHMVRRMPLGEGTRHANFFPRVFLRLSARGPNMKNFEVDFLDNRRSDRCQIFS
jgi:hypothetical protein